MKDTAFTMRSTPYKFGPGVTSEIGWDLKSLGIQRVLVVTDNGVIGTGIPERVLKLLDAAGITHDLFSAVSVEPTDISVKAAIEYARGFDGEGFLAIGGGSVMDTAKIMNLYTTYPAPFLSYLNAPIGEGKAVPGPLRPLVCLPTTAGTSSENTSVAVIDLTELHVKSGISNQHLRATLAILDPLNSLTVPALVTACSGADVLTHAIESYTNLYYNEREAPRTPAERPPYVGANPISDIWCEKAIRLVAEFLPKAVRDGSNLEARTQMMLATLYAGMGFSNAGVQIPHAMGYPIAGNVKGFHPSDYPQHKALVPHGMSTSLGAPAVFEFTAQAKPERHRLVAQWMGAKSTGKDPHSAGQSLREVFIRFMQDIGMPNGLKSVGYSTSDIPALAEGTMKQTRLISLAPRPTHLDDVAAIFERSMTIW
ncbi:MAG: iron-containing alcohol dehydrogenase [Deltaproteobacteria bacterium]|nr:iron-containing alcohol dehydrogenase [Deltaproteobacteria bacterium]